MPRPHPGRPGPVRAVSAPPSVNAGAAPLVAALVERAEALRVGVARMEDGTRVVDAGIDHRGGIEAGLLIARICMGGLGDVALRNSPVFPAWPWQVEVRTSRPVLACLGSQYAGWSLSFDAPGKFSALGSGPARALAVREPLFEELGYRDRAGSTCLVLETDRHPPPALAEKVSRDCGVAPERVTLVLTPTGSLSGVVQIAARVVEVALHKAHELGFPLDSIVDGAGSTPLPPPVGDPLIAMGRTNDTILFGGQVHLFVSCGDEQAEDLARRLPSGNSGDYGKPFAEVFRDYGYDFFRIDPMLFSPARVAVTALGSGRTFHGGRLDGEALDRSFGGGA